MSVLTALQRFIPDATQADVDAYAPLFTDAAACLSSYPQEVQDLTLALATAHLIEQTAGNEVTSEKTRTGASASYAVGNEKGVLSTRFGRQLNGLPSGQCVIGLMSKPQRFIRSINPCH